MSKKNKKIKTDKRQLEPNHSVTKQFALSCAMLAYDELHHEDDVVKFAYKMINYMRTVKPKNAVMRADELLQNKD